MLLVFKEPDFGSTLIYGSALSRCSSSAACRGSTSRASRSSRRSIALSVLWFLPAAGVEVSTVPEGPPDRLRAPDVDPSGTTYNVNQSITASAREASTAAGVAGASQTNMNYLPEHNTDFIFSSLAEQRGFLGAAILLLSTRSSPGAGSRSSPLAPSLYTSVVAGAIVFSFLFQIFVNVGMTIGIAP
jgi:rod shape determining protein RodA